MPAEGLGLAGQHDPCLLDWPFGGQGILYRLVKVVFKFPIPVEEAVPIARGHSGSIACMSGLVIGGLFLALAVFFLAKGLLMKRRERLLLARLIPVKARVTDQGTTPSTSVFEGSDSNPPRHGRSNTQTITLTVYEGQYEYRVGGQTYFGKARSENPVFRKDQMPPREIAVFHDSTNPAVSRLSNVHPDTDVRMWISISVFVLVVAVLTMIFPNSEWIVARLQEINFAGLVKGEAAR